MRGRAQLLTNRPVICAAFLSVVAALAGCSTASPAAAPTPAGAATPAGAPTQAGGSASAAASSSAEAVLTFTVGGARPVPPNGSQDTRAQTPTAGCDGATLAADKVLGIKVAGGFVLAGFPVAAALLTHFLAGKGTEVDYPAGSSIAQQARSSGAFRAVNREVRRAILRQLQAGQTRVSLSAAQLPTVTFESKDSDLYWGFRGTQGLTVTGTGRRENGRYAGTLSYVIRDSYGFPARDTLHGIGAAMRYLQTACGAPQNPLGAHWFPDTITVTVPFRARYAAN
jgi:hypothetical protein